jgi:hypothetical protein
MTELTKASLVTLPLPVWSALKTKSLTAVESTSATGSTLRF